ASSGSQFYIVQGTVLSKEELTVDMRKLNDGVGQLLQRDDYDSVREELLSLYNNQQFDAYTQKLMSLRPEVEEKLGIKVEKSYSSQRLEAYTTQGGAPHLDETYTVFGEVIDGFDVIDSIAAQPTGARAIEKPNQDVYMTVEVKEVPKKKITQQFGYEFPVQ
ncbi:MAG: peptidylprolyl isomerase, partial [Bacteroidota bacterium]